MRKDKKWGCVPNIVSSFNISEDFAEIPWLPLPVSLGMLALPAMKSDAERGVLTGKYNANEKQHLMTNGYIS